MPNNSDSVVDMVKIFIGDLFEYMLEETNRYHLQNVNIKLERCVDIKMKTMLELLFLMGRVCKDYRDEYWMDYGQNN